MAVADIITRGYRSTIAMLVRRGFETAVAAPVTPRVTRITGSSNRVRITGSREEA